MRKCIYCHKNIKTDELLIVVFDPETQYILYYCCWWHLIKWYLKKWLRRFYKKGNNP